MSKKVLKGIKMVTEGQFSAETGNLYMVKQTQGGGYVQLDGKKYGDASGKQDALVSGTNIKTVNGTSILGSGDLNTGNVFEAGAGQNSAVLKGGSNSAIGVCAVAEGSGTNALGNWSHAEGYYTSAENPYAHAEGSNTVASHGSSHAEGNSTTAAGDSSHAEGTYTLASGSGSHAEGLFTKTRSYSEHAEGRYNKSNSSRSESGTTQHSVGIGDSEDNRKNAFEIMQNGDAYLYGVGGYDGTNASANTSSTLQQVLSNVGCLTETTWSNLKSLRDSSGLTPGMQYRITDYNTTTVQSNTQAAGHQFDIIVVADNEYTLNENARAIRHSGDTYFSGSTLEAWELKYDIDNDTTKYAWADSGSTGRGVIYWMKDEWNNECPYDFKNIMFKPGAKTQPGTVANVFYYTFSVATGTNDATVTDHSLNGVCYGNKMGIYISSSKQTLPFNVFRNTSAASNCNTNTFGNNCRYITFGDKCQRNTFGNICTYNTFGSSCQYNIFGNNCINNTFGNSCQSNTFGDNCQSNTFGDSCQSITFGNICSYNTFGNGCRYNTFGDNCQDNTFGNSCNFNTFGKECNNNTFGDDCGSSTFSSKCESNIFGNGCRSNTFENGCTSNTFGDNCSSNTFENDCRRNTFENMCNCNTFGNGCQSNTFGNMCNCNTFGSSCARNTFVNKCFNNTFGSSCESNIFGNMCRCNTFGNGCQSNTFGNYYQSNTFGESVQYFITGNATGATTSAQTNDYIQYLIVENGVRSVNAYCTGTTSDESYCQNIKIGLGVKGTSSSNRMQIDITPQIGATASATYQPSNSQVISI